MGTVLYDHGASGGTHGLPLEVQLEVSARVQPWGVGGEARGTNTSAKPEWEHVERNQTGSQPGSASGHMRSVQSTIIQHTPPVLRDKSFMPSITENPGQATFGEEEVRKGIAASTEIVADQENGTISQASLSLRPSPQNSSANLTMESQTTIYNKSDQKIHYRPPEAPPTDVPRSLTLVAKPGASSVETLSRVLKLRRRVQALRHQAQLQRNLLQVKQFAKADADEQYMKCVRTRHVTAAKPAEVGASELTTLENLWKLSQKARDECGPVEEALSAMEDRLEAEETKLERVEERFYEQLQDSEVSPFILPPTAAFPHGHDKDQSSASSKSSTETEAEYEPTYEDYLRRLGDQDILQESYEDLLREKRALEAEQERRRRVGIDLESEDLEFLASFADRIRPVRQELQEVSEDVERLKQQCIEERILDGAEALRTEMEGDKEPVSDTGMDGSLEIPSPHNHKRVATGQATVLGGGDTHPGQPRGGRSSADEDAQLADGSPAPVVPRRCRRGRAPYPPRRSPRGHKRSRIRDAPTDPPVGGRQI